MDEILSRNISLLKVHQPNVYKKLSLYIEGKYQPNANTVERILLGRNGDLVVNMLAVVKGREYLICDHEDPINQAYKWIDSFIEPSNKAEIVFGLGFGFHLEVLINSFPKKKVIIVEPEIELLHQIFKVRNMENIIKNCEILVDEDMDVILKRIYALYWDTKEGDIQCQPFEVYGDMFPDKWEELRTKFIKQAESFNVDIATNRVFGELWMLNYIINCNKIANASNAQGLLGKFKGVPGILVSAGPSLDRNVGLLKELKDKCVIMAGGTAVNILEEYGIAPHFMVAIDAMKEEADIHKKVKSRDIYFLYSNQVAPESIEVYKGPKFVMNYPTDTYTAGLFDYSRVNSEVFLSGPSVSNTCFDVLYKMGCNPIILLGQDLAFTRGVNYAGGNPGPIIDDFVEKAKEGLILTKDIYGNDVYTQQQYLAMRNWYEGYFEKVKNSVEIINATEGGLNIQYARNDTLSNVLNKYNFVARDINSCVKEILISSKFEGQIEIKLKEYKRYIRDEISKIEGYSGKQMKLVELVDREIHHPSKREKILENTTRQINELTDKIMSAPIYKTVLRTLIEIEFYVVKRETDQELDGLTDYKAAKKIFVNAIRKQNKILHDRLFNVKKLLEIN